MNQILVVKQWCVGKCSTHYVLFILAIAYTQLSKAQLSLSRERLLEGVGALPSEKHHRNFHFYLDTYPTEGKKQLNSPSLGPLTTRWLCYGIILLLLKFKLSVRPAQIYGSCFSCLPVPKVKNSVYVLFIFIILSCSSEEGWLVPTACFVLSSTIISWGRDCNDYICAGPSTV